MCSISEEQPAHLYRLLSEKRCKCVGGRCHVRESSFYRIQNIRCFGEPRRWGTLEGTPGPGRTAQGLEGTFREPGGGEGGGGGGGGERGKKKKKREGRGILVPPRGLRVYRFCLAQRSLYLGNLQPGREPAPAGAVFEVFEAFSDMVDRYGIPILFKPHSTQIIFLQLYTYRDI